MNGVTTAFWGMVINNYDATDLAMVQSGYPDHMRELVYTFEVGEQGTPHIQAFIKLQRQHRLSFVKKLFPRGSFKALLSDEYILNTKRYAQKLDGTADSPAVHKFHDPTNTIESVMKKLILEYIEAYPHDKTLIHKNRLCIERNMVVVDYKYAKIFVSSVYSAMLKNFAHEMFLCIHQAHTHTHTHTDEILSHEVSIPTYDADHVHFEDGEESPQYDEGEDCEGDEVSETDTDQSGDEGLDDAISEADD